jgi:Holliday junction resolvasome RuvABC endonuclease subunit
MLGVAIFEGASLRFYGIKTLRVPGTPDDVRRAATRVLAALIDTYNPTNLAIQQPLVVQQRSELLAHVIGAIKTTARRKGLVVSEYSPQIVRRFVCTDTQPTKRQAALRLAERYPELGHYLSLPSRWEELYYERIFGAVAVGLAALSTQKLQLAGKHVGAV